MNNHGLFNFLCLCPLRLSIMPNFNCKLPIVTFAKTSVGFYIYHLLFLQNHFPRPFLKSTFYTLNFILLYTAFYTYSYNYTDRHSIVIWTAFLLYMYFIL